MIQQGFNLHTVQKYCFKPLWCPVGPHTEKSQSDAAAVTAVWIIGINTGGIKQGHNINSKQVLSV